MVFRLKIHDIFCKFSCTRYKACFVSFEIQFSVFEKYIRQAIKCLRYFCCPALHNILQIRNEGYHGIYLKWIAIEDVQQYANGVLYCDIG